MDIFKTLPNVPEQDVPEDIVMLCANVINTYIMEDGLSMKENEGILSRILSAGEVFTSHFQKVVYLNEVDKPGFSHWLNTLTLSLFEHAEQYQKIYQALVHLKEAPYFCTDWSLSFAVQSVANQYQDKDFYQFNEFSEKDKEDVLYTTRFIDNLLQEFFSAHH